MPLPQSNSQESSNEDVVLSFELFVRPSASQEVASVSLSENSEEFLRYLMNGLYPPLDLSAFDDAEKNYFLQLRGDLSQAIVEEFDRTTLKVTMNFRTQPEELFESAFLNHSSIATSALLSGEEETALINLTARFKTLFENNAPLAVNRKFTPQQLVRIEYKVRKLLESKLLEIKFERSRLIRQRLREKVLEQSNTGARESVSRSAVPDGVGVYLKSLETSLNEPLDENKFDEALRAFLRYIDVVLDDPECFLELTATQESFGKLSVDYLGEHVFLSHDSIATSVLLSNEEEQQLREGLSREAVRKAVYNHFVRNCPEIIRAMKNNKKKGRAFFDISEDNKLKCKEALKEHVSHVITLIRNKRLRRIRNSQREAQQGSWRGMTVAGAVPTATTHLGADTSQGSERRGRRRRLAKNTSQ